MSEDLVGRSACLWDPALCELRGYHGPFERQDAYDHFPEWEGMGECTLCGSCRHVPSEETRRLLASEGVAGPVAGGRAGYPARV